MRTAGTGETAMLTIKITAWEPSVMHGLLLTLSSPCSSCCLQTGLEARGLPETSQRGGRAGFQLSRRPGELAGTTRQKATSVSSLCPSDITPFQTLEEEGATGTPCFTNEEPDTVNIKDSPQVTQGADVATAFTTCGRNF